MLEYAAAWDGHAQREILGNVKRRSARYVMGDYGRTNSVSSLLQTLLWITLEKADPSENIYSTTAGDITPYKRISIQDDTSATYDPTPTFSSPEPSTDWKTSS